MCCHRENEKYFVVIAMGRSVNPSLLVFNFRLTFLKNQNIKFWINVYL